MKRIITAIVILSVMSAACFWSVTLVDNFVDKLLGMIEEVETAFEDEDMEKTSKAAENLHKEWTQFLDKAIFVNDLGHSVEITSSIAEIHSFAQEGDNELYAACDRAAAQLKMFRNMQTPTFMKVL